MSAIRSIVSLLGMAGNDIHPVLKQMEEEDLNRLATVLLRPDLDVRYNRTSETLAIVTAYGEIYLDGSNLPAIKNVRVNGLEYETIPDLNGMDALEHLMGSYGEVMMVLDSPKGRQANRRQSRQSGRQIPEDVPLSQIQETAYADLSKVGITYDNLLPELGGVVQNLSISAQDIAGELFSNSVLESDIPHFLIYDSSYKMEIMSRMYNYNVAPKKPTYHYETVTSEDDSFVGRLLRTMGKETAQYDREQGVLTLDEYGFRPHQSSHYQRHITNLPRVDEHGVFHTGDTAYLPYYLGYFAEGTGERAERLRVIDPVEQALNGVHLQYMLTNHGDIKFKTLLDVTRHLPNFDNHPHGEAILETLKRKVVLAGKYRESNSLLAEHTGSADELGSVALTMLDEASDGVIDPYGTSNGRTLGMIFYLTKDATIEDNGSITPGESKFSAVGDVINQFHVDRDNFNRNQMSFNALLTSTDVQERNVFVGEFAFWNMEDAIVLTNDLNGEAHVGDKMMDFHGNKSTVSVILSQLTDEEIKEKHLEHAVQFAKDNPHVDIITSPSSLASRLNMGIVYEGLNGATSDVRLPDGTVVKDGQIQLQYMKLPQTAAYKSKDYTLEGEGRRYSTLLRYALMAKVGDLYKDGLLSQEVHDRHVDEAISTFERLGVSFKQEEKLVEPDNVRLYVDAPVTVHMNDFQHIAPAAIRMSLMHQMVDNKINIDLGDIELNSRLYPGAITDSQGRNVLPIRVPEGNTIPYRYMQLFTQISRGNVDGIQQTYRNFSNMDYGSLTVKDNILKNIDTMTFKDGAKTTVIVPDPSLGLNQVRSNLKGTREIMHRDPAIQCGNALSMENIGGAKPNVLHINPLMVNMVDGDHDGDTAGENDYDNLNLSEAQKQEFFERSNVTDRVNFYGEVHLGTGSSYFKALTRVNNIDTSDITFADGKSSQALIDIVEDKTRQILDSPKSYGAYALSFVDEQTAKDSLCKMADDGIKGNRNDMERYLLNGYSRDENFAIAKALIAKSEWTGLAGATTNKLLANLGPDQTDVLRSAMDVTHSMTQATLQMKKNADKLPIIDASIKEMKKVMDGRYTIEESRDVLKDITAGLLPKQAVDTFVNQVASKQDADKNFGYGVINNKETTTMKLSYATAKSFERAIQTLGEEAQKMEESEAL